MEIKEVVRIIQKHFLLVLAIVLTLTGAVAFYSYTLMKPIYQANSNIVVNNNIINDLGDKQLTYDTLLTNRGLVSTYKKIIQNPIILNKVVTQHPELGLSSVQILKKLQVISEENEQIITLSVKDTSYQKAALIVNAITKIFVETVPIIMKTDNIMILNQAPEESSVELDPISWNPALIVVIAVFVSLFLGFGLANVVEYFDVTIKSERDVELAIGCSVLAKIPKVKSNQLKMDSTLTTHKRLLSKQVTINTVGK